MWESGGEYVVGLPPRAVISLPMMFRRLLMRRRGLIVHVVNGCAPGVWASGPVDLCRDVNLPIEGDPAMRRDARA